MNTRLLITLQELRATKERLVQDVYYYQMCEDLRPEETAKDFFRWKRSEKWKEIREVNQKIADLKRKLNFTKSY